MRCVIFILIILLLATVVAGQETYMHLYGEVQGAIDGDTIRVKVDNNYFNTTVKEGKYGYDPSFLIRGNSGEIAEIYFKGEKIAEQAIGSQETHRIDIGEELIVKVVEGEPLPVIDRNEDESYQLEPRNKKPYFLYLTLIISLLGIVALLLFFRYRYSNDYSYYKIYIKKMMDSGYTAEQIKDSLRKRGWNEEQINFIFSKL